MREATNAGLQVVSEMGTGQPTPAIAVMHAALSPTRPISAEEQQSINDLRTILPSIECLEDSYVLRWLRAKDLRFDETADALKKHVVFRKAWELDAISSWEAPEVCIILLRFIILVRFYILLV
ncbi:hypothetical protein DICVIV_03933 [Dictyocaulus viviparus]|uniref:CRAL/TRIO N-terminal domain-containing protein n=1 Tax=Dictyocaulus viviparus TaxID=29172 RepID=A0A0D8Y1I0_DICVI|nr:hypothetical protein DICVIV_03933 [Dictyocaulus viviparus]